MSDKSKQRARALASEKGISHQAAVNRLRKSRVLPEHAGFTTVSRLLVRPFEALANGFNREKLPVRAEVRGTKLVLYVLGQQVEVEAIEVLRDKRGAVAVLKPGHYPLRDAFELELQAEAHEPSATGLEPTIQSVISVRREGAARQAVREAVDERLGPVNLVMAHESSYSLYFHADGTIESWLLPDRPQPSLPRDHEPTEHCFSVLDARLWQLFLKEKYGEEWRRVSKAAFIALHEYAATQVRPWVWEYPLPKPSADPVDAAFHDAWQAAQRWMQPMARRRDASSRELVKPEDLLVYDRTLGLIAHAVEAALEDRFEATSRTGESQA